MYVNNLNIETLDGRVLIENLSFSLAKGDKAVVIGEEGNGKSTLLKVIYGAKELSSYVKISGAIVANEKIGYLAQELDAGEKTVAEFFDFSSYPFAVSPKQLRLISQELSMDEDIYYSPVKVKNLSGGEKVKIQLAKLLFGECDLLLLDEPSNDIDIGTLIWLEDFINSIDIPIMFVSHDETLIENTANMIIHIEQLRRKTTPRVTVARLDYSTYVEERLFNIERQTQTAKKEKENFEKRQRRWREIYEKVDRDLANCTSRTPTMGRLLKKKMKTVKAQEKRFDKEKGNLAEFPDFEEAVTTDCYGASIPNGKVVLDFSLYELKIYDKTLSKNINLKIVGPKKICITGNNGIGKTTLIKKIYESIKDSGVFKVAYMPQNYFDELDPTATPIDFLTDGTKEGTTKARTYLGCMKYRADEMCRPVSGLSGGQKAKLLYLKMALSDCEVMILDEPTRNFSPITNPSIRRVLSKFPGAIISVSHDRKFIDEVCDTVYRLTDTGLVTV